MQPNIFYILTQFDKFCVLPMLKLYWGDNMKHVVELNPKLEEIYIESSKILGIPVDNILEIALAEYVSNLIPNNKKEALN